MAYVRVRYPHFFGRILWWFRFFLHIGIFAGYGGVLVDYVIPMLGLPKDTRNAGELAALGLSLVATIATALWVTGPMINTLSSYLYVNLSLRTRVSWQEARSVSWLFSGNGGGTWYPLKEIKGLPEEHRRRELFASAECIMQDIAKGYPAGEQAVLQQKSEASIVQGGGAPSRPWWSEKGMKEGTPGTPQEVIGGETGEAPSSLGRLLSGPPKKDKSKPFVLGCLTLPWLMVGGGMLATADKEFGRMWGAGLFGIGVLMTVLGAMASRSSFHWYEQGVVRRTILGSRTVRYARILRFAYRQTDEFRFGIYTGSSFHIYITPMEGEPITYDSRGVSTPGGYLPQCEAISRVIAKRQYQAVIKGSEEVPWGSIARLSSKALTFHTPTLTGMGPKMTLAYSADLRFSIEDGVFRLFVPGESKPVLLMDCGTENFYPGLLVFQQLCADAADRGTPTHRDRDS